MTKARVRDPGLPGVPTSTLSVAPARAARPLGPSAVSGQQVAGGMLWSYWKTLFGSYFALILRSRSKWDPQ